MSRTDSPSQKRIAKWPFILLAIFFAIGTPAYYFYLKYLANDRWKPILQQQLKELVLRSTDSLYHIEYSDFDLNITSGNATLSDFKFVPDTLIYNKLVSLNRAPDDLFILSVKRLSIKTLDAPKAYRDHILDINHITIEKPNLTLIKKRYKFNDTVKIGKPKSPYQIIKKVFKRIHIDSVSLKNISLNYVDKNKAITKQTSLSHLDINISDILIDSLSGNDPNRFYYTRGVDVTIHDYHIATPDSLYFADLKKIYFSTLERKIVLDKVTFLPRYNHNDFYAKAGKGGDIFSLKFKQIQINDLDLQSFLRDQFLYAGSLDVTSPDVQIYSNSNYKGKKTSKIGKDPHQALQNVALDMRLKRLNIKNAKISYAETNPESGATGEILFTHTNGYILNVTNDDDQKKVNPYMRAYINTRFMNVAPLQVNFKFNLVAKDGAFNYSGTLGKFDGRVLDKLVKPLALVHVESCDVEKLSFNVDASNYSGKGNLEFYYKNLKIQLLKKDKDKAELQKQGFISMIANKLIIENSNPNKNGVFRQGPIDLKREPTATFFTFLYKGLLDGLKPSVGYTKKTELKINNTIEKVSKLFSKFKKSDKGKAKDEKKE